MKIIGQVIFWLFIFIVGSLIVTFLISPNSFNNFKDNVKSIFQKKIVQTTNYDIKTIKDNQINEIEVLKQDYEEVKIPSDWGMNRCSVIEALADQNGISENTNKKRLCTFFCGQNNMEYGYFNCITDKFYCYCIN